MAKLGTSSGFGIKVCNVNVVVPGHLKNLEASNVKSCVIYKQQSLGGSFLPTLINPFGKKKKSSKKSNIHLLIEINRHQILPTQIEVSIYVLQ